MKNPPDQTDSQTIQLIELLWQHHIPPKVIAQALHLKYPLVSLYCRSFKAISKQLPPGQVLKNISLINKD